jgi:uncharacterized delta-60 repeat protein
LFAEPRPRLASFLPKVDGKIVVVGTSIGSGSDEDFAMARYNVDGTLDDSFNATGKVLTDFGGVDDPFGVVTDSKGRIVAAGFSNANGTSDFALARYLP